MHVLSFLRKFSELLGGPGTEVISFTGSRAVVAGISSRREVNILFLGEISVVFVGEIVFDCFIFAADTYGEAFVVLMAFGEIVFDCFIFAANTYGKAFVVLIASRVEHFEGEDTGKIANFFSGTNIHFIVQYSDKVQ